MKKKKAAKKTGNINSIFIRELDSPQNATLKRLREDLQEGTNTKAVWGAVEKYFPLKREIEKLNKEILGLENKLSRADQEVNELREYVREYFAFQDETEKRNDGYIKKLRTLVSKRPSARSRAIGLMEDIDA